MAHVIKNKCLSHKLSFITCSLAFASSAVAAEDRGTSVVTSPKPRFGTASRWVFGVEGLALLGYSSGVPPLDADPPPFGLTAGVGLYL
jgi:hypothetical protein